MHVADWLINSGLTREILLILIYIPILATVINVMRYILGTKTFGIYAPLTLAFAYTFTGLRFGLLITIAVILSTLLSYQFLRKIRMHYISRIAMNYTLVSYAIILTLFLVSYLPVSILPPTYVVAAIPPLGIILIVALSDFFIKQYVKRSITSTIRTLIETVLMGVVGWAIIIWDAPKDFLLQNFAWILLLLFIINLLVGQYQQLRVMSIVRFKKLLKND